MTTRISRRRLLETAAIGFPMLALRGLHAEETKFVAPLAPKPPHFKTRAKRVIFLFMGGGRSHLETFDWKPELAKVGKGGHHQLLGAVIPFKPAGASGIMISEAFPHLAAHADDLCL